MQLEQKPLIAPIFFTLSDSTFFPNVNPVVDQKIPDASKIKILPHTTRPCLSSACLTPK